MQGPTNRYSPTRKEREREKRTSSNVRIVYMCNVHVYMRYINNDKQIHRPCFGYYPLLLPFQLLLPCPSTSSSFNIIGDEQSFSPLAILVQSSPRFTTHRQQGSNSTRCFLSLQRKRSVSFFLEKALHISQKLNSSHLRRIQIHSLLVPHLLLPILCPLWPLCLL